MTISTDDLGRITQQTAVVTEDGERLGTINQIYTSDQSGDPAWITLKTGVFGTKESFVPLGGASFDGDDIRVPVTKDAVHGAPRVDTDGHLSPEEEDELYRHYGLHNPDRPDGDPAPAADLEPGRGLAGNRDEPTDGRVGDGRTDDEHHGGHAAASGAAAGLPAAETGPNRDDELAARDAEGRDEVADLTGAAPRRAETDDRVGAGLGERTEVGQDAAVRPGERTTRLKRYVVTERVVQTVEELPDEDLR